MTSGKVVDAIVWAILNGDCNPLRLVTSNEKKETKEYRAFPAHWHLQDMYSPITFTVVDKEDNETEEIELYLEDITRIEEIND